MKKSLRIGVALAAAATMTMIGASAAVAAGPRPSVSATPDPSTGAVEYTVGLNVTLWADGGDPFYDSGIDKDFHARFQATLRYNGEVDDFSAYSKCDVYASPTASDATDFEIVYTWTAPTGSDPLVVPDVDLTAKHPDWDSAEFGYFYAVCTDRDSGRLDYSAGELSYVLGPDHYPVVGTVYAENTCGDTDVTIRFTLKSSGDSAYREAWAYLFDPNSSEDLPAGWDQDVDLTDYKDGDEIRITFPNSKLSDGSYVVDVGVVNNNSLIGWSGDVNGFLKLVIDSKSATCADGQDLSLSRPAASTPPASSPAPSSPAASAPPATSDAPLVTSATPVASGPALAETGTPDSSLPVGIAALLALAAGVLLVRTARAKAQHRA